MYVYTSYGTQPFSEFQYILSSHIHLTGQRDVRPRETYAHGRSRFSFDVSDGRICDPTAAAGLRDPVHRGARDDGPGALDHGDHATDIRPRVCAGQILRGAVRQQIFWGTSYDWSILGLGYSRFMIQESGSCLVSARGWQFTHSYKRPCQQFTSRRIRDDERVRLHRTRRRRRV